MAITKLILNGTEYEIGNLVESEGPQLYDGRELSEYTWAQLQTKCTNADYDDLRIGDYKTISLTTGETVVCQIAGIDTYYKGIDTAVGHHIDFISKDCLSTTVQWNTSNNNNGNSTSSVPYLVSNVYDWLQNTVYGTVPSDVKAVISNKRMLMGDRYSSSGTLTDDTTWEWVDLGPIWLPTEFEIFGAQVWGTKGYGAGTSTAYPLFADSMYHRIKGAGANGSRCHWWLSTVRSGTSTHCCIVSTNGSANIGGASGSYRVPLCFRVEG